MSARRRRSRDLPAPQLLEEYLARGPEANPALLLPPTALLLARAALLFHGVLTSDWSVAWLIFFQLAELHFVLRLMTVGNRLTGLKPGGGVVTRTDVVRAVAWAALAFGLAFGAGVGLADSGAAELFSGVAEEEKSESAIYWTLLAYLGLEVVELVRAVVATRRRGRRFVSPATVSAAFFVLALCLSPILFFFLIYGLALFPRIDAPRSALAITLLVAKYGAELCALWLPLWAERLGLRLPPRLPDRLPAAVRLRGKTTEDEPT